MSGRSSTALQLIITAAVFLAVGILLAGLVTNSGDSNTLDPDQIQAIVREAVGTQVADLGSPGGSVDRASLQLAIDQAVGTQIAALQPSATPLPPTPTRVPNDLAAADAPFLGPADAPVVIVEFSDYQCPYCLRFYKDTLPQILEKYPTEVKFVYRDFPIFGEDSIRAAMAARCAEDQGKFWEMHDAIFSSREEDTPPALSQDTLMSFAQDLGLDTGSFDQCLTDQQHQEQVNQDYQAASTYGFGGTPTFLINGQYISGAQPFSIFDQIIQTELSSAG